MSETLPPLPRSVAAPDAATPVSTSDAGQVFDEGEGRIFPCDGCGADLKFHIGDQALSCPYCGHRKQIELDEEAAVVEQDYHQMLQRVREWKQQQNGSDDAESDQTAADARKELRCDSCGGNVEFIGTLTSSHCPYCGSPVQLEKAHRADQNRIPVDGVLPFQVDQPTARQNLGEWVKSRWFAPNDFLKQGADGRFNGVYLSYHTFDSMTFTSYSGQRGEYYWVTEGSGDKKRRVRKTRWYPASGRFQRFFDDVLVLANTGFSRKFMQALEPWPLAKVVPFNQQMLAGHLARTYDMELDTCFDDAKQRIDEALYSDVCSRIGGDTQQVHSVDSRYDAITFKHLLLPVWLLAYRYRDRTFQVFINAATGEVQGERPYSVWKIMFAVLAGLAVAGFFALTSQR